jgi:Sortase domain
MTPLRHRPGKGWVLAWVLVPALLAGGAVLLLTGGQRTASGSDARLPRPHLRLAHASHKPGVARPVEVSVPSVDIDAQVVPTGANASGIVVPPVSQVGWFKDGPRPGEPGRTILIAHIDSVDGPAAFTGLPGVARGATITVTSTAGWRLRYRVSRTLQVPKPEFPAKRVYAPTKRSTLVLVTCTGAFHPDTGYEDNFIVLANQVG